MAKIQSLNLLRLPARELRDEINFLVESNPFLSANYSSSSSDFYNFINNFEVKRRLLKDVLREQLRVAELSDLALEVGEELLTGINSDGFWIKDAVSGRFFIDDYIEDFVNSGRGSGDFVRGVVSVLQGFEPLGCFCFNQLETAFIVSRNDGDVSASVLRVLERVYNFIIENPYDDAGKFLLEVCDGDNLLIEEIRDFFEGKSFVPGKNFDDGSFREVADIAIFVMKDNSVKIRLNRDYPSISLDERQIALRSKSLSSEDKEFFTKNINLAKQSVASIVYREKTLERLAYYLAEEQKEFIRGGKRFLKPLLQKEVAVFLGVNESTVSRLAKEKLIQTNVGLFLLKDFFSTSIGGNSVSRVALKEMIRDILDDYREKKLPLPSDRVITEILNKKEIEISRRTVNKYRAEIYRV